ncbi:MAG: hypothetical protein ACLFPL_02680 [Candidatus Nanoarchaeia archaeon]
MVESKKTTSKHKESEKKSPKSAHHNKNKDESHKTHHAKHKDTKAHERKTTPHTAKNKETKTEKEYNPQILFTIIGVGIVIIIAVFLIAMNIDFLSSKNDQTAMNDESPLSSQNNESSGNEVVASVNGEEITAQEVSQIQQQLSTQGQQVSQEQAVQQLVTNTILLQQTQNDVEAVTNEEAEAELEQLLSEQGFTTQDLRNDLEQQGISYEQTLQDFKQRIVIDRFLEENIDTSSVEVSDEEVQLAYTQYEQQMGNQTPPFSQVEAQIRNQLEQEQIQQLQSQFIQQLIEEAEVEYY